MEVLKGQQHYYHHLANQKSSNNLKKNRSAVSKVGHIFLRRQIYSEMQETLQKQMKLTQRVLRLTAITCGSHKIVPYEIPTHSTQNRLNCRGSHECLSLI